MVQFHTTDWWARALDRMLQDQTPEDLHLDYKERRSLVPPGRGGNGGIDKPKRAEDISKDVSAFLNFGWGDSGVWSARIHEPRRHRRFSGPGRCRRWFHPRGKLTKKP